LFILQNIVSAGSELLATELRMRTCVEMVNYREKYLAHSSASIIDQLSPNFDAALRCCSEVSGYTCMWALFALSSVVRRKIVSIYPMMNDDDTAAQIGNITLSPLVEVLVDVLFYVMWTRQGSSGSAHWTPNHFVPLFRHPGA